MIKKAIVIGWDGATWDYIDPLLATGKLPHLEKLLARGTKSVLRSTIPPFTNIAWPSMVTGLSPAKTGIFDGAKTRPGSYEAIPTNLANYKGIPIWHWLNKYGQRTAVLNVPMTYPARPLDGYLVSGFDSPEKSSQVVYPANLLEQWAEQGHPYSILADEIALMNSQNPHQVRGSLVDFVSGWVRLTRQQGQHIAWLWSQDDVDFLFTVFSGTDSINHRTRDFDKITEVYEAADKALGDILAVVDDETLVCLVSDHGSTPAYRYLSLYRALHERGWLHFRPQVAPRYWHRLPGPFSQIWQRIPNWLRRIISWPLLKVEGRLAIAYDNIDWEKTKVFAISGMGPIYINRRGWRVQGCVDPDEYEAVRQEVCDHLLGLQDEVGGSLIQNICFGESIYSDASPDDVPPDLVLEPAQWSDHMITGFPSDPVIRPILDSREYGTHTPDGILALAGPNVQANCQISAANIIDVMPTLVAAFNLPIPENVNGQILQSAFANRIAEQRAPALTTISEIEATYSDVDVEEVMKRLQALGYME